MVGLLPHLSAVMIDRVRGVGDVVVLFVRARLGCGTCPGCGASSSRVHARYERRLVDVPIGGRRVEVRATVRRFRCDVSTCPVVTFVEQIVG